MKWPFGILIVLLCINPFVQAANFPDDFEPLKLLGRSQLTGVTLKLSEIDRGLLREKKIMRVGVVTTDASPLGLSTSTYDYEGIAADYLELIAGLLNVEIQIQRYQARIQAVEALKRGEVDLLGIASAVDATDPELVVSRSYLDDQPVLVSRRDSNAILPKDLAGQQLAMAEYDPSVSLVRAHYPLAKLQLYPTDLDAISAVVFDQADVYLGGATTASYLINRNFLSDVYLTDFASLDVTSIGFALRVEDQQLLGIVNRALITIPAEESTIIKRRWGVETITVSDHDKIELSPNEQRWLANHPHLRVAVLENSPPLAFFDQQGSFRGISADLLAVLRRRTGLTLEVTRAYSLDGLVELVKNGKADFIAAFNPNAANSDLRFTRSYLTTPYVLSVRTGDEKVGSLDDLAGKRLAIRKGGDVRGYIGRYYPQIILVDTADATDALSMVAEGKADAAVTTWVNARYLIATRYQSRVRVSRTVGLQPAQIALATDRGSLELYSILDKVMMSLSPQELDELTSRWRNEVVVDNKRTQANQSEIIRGSAIAAILLLAAFGWIIYLQRLIQRREVAEQALNEQMEFMRVLIDGLPHPIYVRDRKTRMLLCNQRFLEAVGSTREKIIGTRLSETGIIDSSLGAVFERQYLEVMEGGQELIADCQLSFPNGQVITAYHWILPFRDNSDEVKGIIAGWIDISERERLLEQLTDAKKDADKANRAKTTFLATMSHEIRTPMNAVVGMLELAMKKADQGILDRFAIDVASGAARGLLELIGDILDVVRIESERLTLVPQRAALKELVVSVVRVFEGLARQKQLSLVLSFDEKANKDVLIDPIRFKQVLSNLIGNAIKFTSVGQVQVCVKVTHSANNQSMGVQVLVRDTGIGISVDDQQRLFVPFNQASHSSAGGSGLGLAISRKLCSMMQGELNLASVLGQGTQTEVLLELEVLAPLPPTRPEPVLPEVGKVLKVLVVDDYPANRLLLSQQLSYLGHTVDDEPDGAHGLCAWRNGHFDVVITDCNMPVMTGYELARAIRAEEADSGAARCLILGFTANAQPEEKDRCLEAGMDDCLFKPISMKDLTARLSGVELVFDETGDADGSIPLSDDIDLRSLEQLAHGDRTLVNSLLRDLASSNEEDLLRLLKLYSDHDLSGLSDLGHRVKGGARIIKAHRLIQCCEQLQTECNGHDAVRLTQAVDALHEAMEALAQRLEACID
ncbi:transporter substrate-binding domain-containing protein [Pseudomonas sp. ADAK18]|uniref:ATP-binding protein n=1 Tax=Pseudomonas sp. ADAK18 TaxID=2730848 RepID=UPI001462C7C3|nr:transporter substrate-binding domain-containing protein [Pseudomonas sp. ADAK18]QJI31254.1 transporter substrate-binding domain-containing protein [Pseudomonas sp. ADAK18]